MLCYKLVDYIAMPTPEKTALNLRKCIEQDALHAARKSKKEVGYLEYFDAGGRKVLTANIMPTIQPSLPSSERHTAVATHRTIDVHDNGISRERVLLKPRDIPQESPEDYAKRVQKASGEAINFQSRLDRFNELRNISRNYTFTKKSQYDFT